MPTDEQRMRREFEAWAEGVDLSPDFAAEREKCPDDPTHGWNYGKLTAWEAWLARDAEVQALREALSDMLSGWRYIRAYHGDLYGVGWNRAQNRAEAALAGGETGETE